MPYSIRTKDGITISNIPDDVPKDDPRLKAMVAQLRAAGQKEGSFAPAEAAQESPASGTPQEGSNPVAAPPAPARNDAGAGGVPVAEQQAAEAAAPQEPRTDAEGIGGAVMRGLGPYAAAGAAGGVMGLPFAGVGAVPGVMAGVGAMGLTQFVGDPVVDLINKLMGTKLTRPTDALNQLFTKLGVPEPDTAVERVIQAASSGAGSAASTVALGKALASAANPLAPSITQAISKALASGAPQQIASGAGGLASSQTAAELGAGPLVQFASGLGGSMAFAPLGGKTRLAPSKFASAPLDEAAAAGVRILPSDVFPPKTRSAAWLQNQIDDLPFGPNALRAKQGAERIAATKKLLSEFGADDVAAIADDVTADLLATRKGTVGKYSKAKLEVIGRLSETGAPVPMTKTAAKIDDALAALQRSDFSENKPLIDKLQDWRAKSQGKALIDIEDFRDIVRQAKADPSLATVKNKAAKVADEVYRAVKEDMGDFITANGNPGDVAKWRDADKNLAIMIGELKVPALKSALNRGEGTPEQVYRVLNSTEKSTVQLLHKNLSPKGRVATQAAIISKAAGVDEDPDKLAAGIKKMANQVGVFFSGDDLERVNGIARVMEFTKHAKSATQLPRTGALVMPLATYAGTATALSHMMNMGTTESLALAAGGMGTASLLARAYNNAFSWMVKNPEVRSILKKIPAVVKGSPEEFKLMHRLMLSTRTFQQAPRDPGRDPDAQE